VNVKLRYHMKWDDHARSCWLEPSWEAPVYGTRVYMKGGFRTHHYEMLLVDNTWCEIEDSYAGEARKLGFKTRRVDHK